MPSDTPAVMSEKRRTRFTAKLAPVGSGSILHHDAVPAAVRPASVQRARFGARSRSRGPDGVGEASEREANELSPAASGARCLRVRGPLARARRERGSLRRFSPSPPPAVPHLRHAMRRCAASQRGEPLVAVRAAARTLLDAPCQLREVVVALALELRGRRGDLARVGPPVGLAPEAMRRLQPREDARERPRVRRALRGWRALSSTTFGPSTSMSRRAARRQTRRRRVAAARGDRPDENGVHRARADER